jgi:hypothetical protein
LKIHREGTESRILPGVSVSLSFDFRLLAADSKMKTISLFSRMLVTGLFFAIGIGGIVSAGGWLKGWDSARQFSDGLFIAGALVFLIGLFIVLGGFTSRANFGIVYSQSAGDMPIFERTKQNVTEMLRGYRALAMCSITGGALALFSILVYQIFG